MLPQACSCFYTNCQLVCFTSLTNSQQLLKGRFCLHISDGSRARRQRYLRKHDILPSSAQCDAEKVVDCRSIPEADSPVILLVRGTADHCVPVCLGTDTNSIRPQQSKETKQNNTTPPQEALPITHGTLFTIVSRFYLFCFCCFVF